MGYTGPEILATPAEKPEDWVRQLTPGAEVDAEVAHRWVRFMHGNKIVVVYGSYQPYRLTIYDPERVDTPIFHEVYDLRSLKEMVFRWLLQGLR